MKVVCKTFRRLRLWLCWTAVLLLSATSLRATHVIGGDINMQAVGTTPGLFRIQLNQYWDQTKTGPGNRDTYVTLLIYRKQDPKLIDTLRLPLREALPLTFNNSACAKSLELNFTEARYYDTHQFDPTLYTDPGGYYMVWERCCRNDALSNAVSVGAVGGVAMVFYLEFPPMQVSNRSFVNSSPDFGVPNGDYICVNKSFTFSAGAKDADGDQLRYSLVTPLNGYTNRNTPLGNSSVKQNYPTITWAPGISLANIIPGNPPLSINPATGQLTVRASAQGLFVFTVQCEEFRNGQRIGLVRRDFQLPVIDCSRTTPPPAVVTVDKVPQTSVVWCSGQPLTLAIAPNPQYAYQWQKDGANLRGDTLATLTVKEPGRYSVVTSQAKTCSNDTTSQEVVVTQATASTVSLSQVGQPPNCTGDTVLLRAAGSPDYQYRWRRDGKDIVGAQQATLRVNESGRYTVLVRPVSNVCEGRDSLQVTINARPVTQLSASTLAFCPDASSELTVPDGSGNRYVWQLDGSNLPEVTNRLTARQSGTYQVTVTNPAGCTATSAKLTLTRYDGSTVQLDSIAPLCSTDSSVVTLRGQPAGGVYAGPGITGDQFNPAVAGVGQHRLTYTVTIPNGCPTAQSRYVSVLRGPTLTGPTQYQIPRGERVQLQTQSNELIKSYRWEPPTDLSRSDVDSPVASPTQTTPYQLIAVDSMGCASTFSVRVEVVEPLYIPSAFTPNADGLNDTWAIPNSAAFPFCEVAVYNRWGELVFYSKGYTRPWDGTYRQVPVDEGVYTYRILTGPGALDTVYRGKVTVIH